MRVGTVSVAQTCSATQKRSFRPYGQVLQGAKLIIQVMATRLKNNARRIDRS